MTALTPYVAFLRGINVGGNKIIKMDALKKAFAELGFENVKTLLASGNVIFETSKAKPETLAKKLESHLHETFGTEIGVIVRTVDEIRKLAESNPFKKIKVTPETRLYVSFLPEKSRSKLKIPHNSPDGFFKILQATDREVCSVLTLSESKNTVDLMKILEKEFGKKITTRNWNTVTKIAQLPK